MKKSKWNSYNPFNFGSLDTRMKLPFLREFTYGHFKVGKGFATIGGVMIGDNLYYGISFCSPEDNFSKKVGRKLAVYNLVEAKNSHNRGVITLDVDLSCLKPAEIFKEVVYSHLEHMNSHKPQWAKNANVDFRSYDPYVSFKLVVG